MPKKVRLTNDYMRGEAQHISKSVDALRKDINKDGHPKREALKKKVIDQQHNFFKKCKEKDVHTR